MKPKPLVASSLLLIATTFGWKPLYYSLYLPTVTSRSLGKAVYPWNIDRKFVDISRNGTDAFWYFSPGWKVAASECKQTLIPLHISLESNVETSMCRLSYRIKRLSGCFDHVDQIMINLDGSAGVLIYKSLKKFTPTKGCL